MMGTVVKKLKIKIGTKGVGNHCEKDAHENEMKVITNDAQNRHNSSNEKSKHGLNIKLELPVPANSNKRRPQVTLDAEKVKRRKMDRSIQQHCGSVLNVLMTHKLGWPFLQRVDHVAFNIPDYFDIITKPMDLGTVKSKLEDNLYFSVEEFAADVRLTFANCIRYNPPKNAFHAMAKELDSFFIKKWNLMEAKWKSKTGCAEQSCPPNSNGKDSQDANRSCHRKTPLHVNLTTSKRLMRTEDKLKLKNELSDLLKGMVTDTMQRTLQKLGLGGIGKEVLKVGIDKLDDETLWELKRVLKARLDVRAVKAESAEVSEHVLSRKNNNHKDIDKWNSIGIADTKPLARFAESNYDYCGTGVHKKIQSGAQKKIQSGVQKKIQIPSSDHSSCATTTTTGGPKIHLFTDIDKWNSIGIADTKPPARFAVSNYDYCGTSVHKKIQSGVQTKIHSGVQKKIQSPSSDHSSCATTTTTGCTAHADAQLSPTKALRAAMLKSRFAETIFKANHKGDIGNSLKLQQEKERLEKQQRAEKAMIEEKIKAAEASRRLRAEAELKIQR